MHCRVGDTVEVTLTNEVDVPHSMDFHAAQIDLKQAFRSVAGIYDEGVFGCFGCHGSTGSLPERPNRAAQRAGLEA